MVNCFSGSAGKKNELRARKLCFKSRKKFTGRWQTADQNNLKKGLITSDLKQLQKG